eukprot:scaffold31_cov263-Pinguiococcus_pyrenoidosus.AAC.2
MVCIAFMAHYNGMKYYDELESRTPKRYAYTMATGMSIIVAIFTAFMIFGTSSTPCSPCTWSATESGDSCAAALLGLRSRDLRSSFASAHSQQLRDQ